MFQQFFTKVFLTEIKIDIFWGGPSSSENSLGGLNLGGPILHSQLGALNIWGDLKSLGGPRTPLHTMMIYFIQVVCIDIAIKTKWL